MRTRSSLIALAAGLALLVPFAASADTVERTFQVSAGGRLEIDTDLGRIDVREGSPGTVRIVVEREVRGGDDDDFELDFEQSGNTVRVTGEKPDSWGWGGWNRYRVAYKVEVPRDFDVQLETSGGDVSVASLDGDVDCRTSGGDVELADVGGRVDCRTSGGDIEVGTVTGAVMAKTSGGDIHIGRSGGSVIAKTSGGDVTIDEVFGQVEATTSGGNVRARLADQPRADCKLTTSGGRIELAVDPSISADIDASTSGGRVHVDFPVSVSGSLSKTRLNAELNGGGPQIYLRTSGGSIHIEEI